MVGISRGMLAEGDNRPLIGVEDGKFGAVGKGPPAPLWFGSTSAIRKSNEERASGAAKAPEALSSASQYGYTWYGVDNYSLIVAEERNFDLRDVSRKIKQRLAPVT